MTYDKVELHLNTDPLSRAHVKRIKDCGGTYSECRSPYAARRYVTVPASESTLINELAKTYFADNDRRNKGMVIIARGGVDAPAWVNVQHIADPVMCGKDAVEQFEQGYAKSYAQAVRRGIIKEKGVDNA